MEEISKDPRFAHVPKDPKFRRIPKSERKIKIDKRFQSMFKDKNFKVTYTIDKRGRPLKKSSAEDLEKYYELSSESEDDPEEKPKRIEKNSQKKSSRTSKKPQEKKKSLENSTVDETDNGPEDEQSESQEDLGGDEEKNEKQLQLRRKNESTGISREIKTKLRDLSVDYARGEGALVSDSSSDDDSSEESDEDEGIEHMWGELDREADTTDEITSRLAACNMDWDRIRAVDLMVLFNSFLPPGGLIHSVTIYPSEFGLERLKEEEMKGPIELRDNDEDESGGEDDEEGNDFHREKLRQYQLNRLKYYYAVIAFDSKASANKIYTECDGHEYESTATKIDLRFIPEDMEFDQTPKEICDKLPDVSKYQPRQFTTTALQQVKVQCTWDETKLDRQEITKKINSGKIDDIDENDIKIYLASGSSDEEADIEEGGVDDDIDGKINPLDKYKSLLKSIEQQEEEKKRKSGDLEFTWGLGTKEKAEKLVEKKMKESEKLTPFEQYLEKRKEKKKAKREEKKKLKNPEVDQASDSEDSVPSDVDMNDPYFAEELGKTRVEEKFPRKRDKGSSDESDGAAQREAELELLLLDREDEQKRHFDMKKIEETEALTKSKKKRLNKRKKEQVENAPEDDFQVNVEDPRFGALFTSHHFNIDPADSHYRKTKGTEALIKEKLKRRANGEVQAEVVTKQSRSGTNKEINSDLAALIKSVKRNTKNVMKPIK
ncbi:ESF1 homolog [Fopius arisanus]|uniref:ESF1 homolog n=1 Tax=Fopius arisanus TaxID=64838 RepID=A0A9R1T207_9HYME|nr:PREDICTED: ESF1 homolog [Fopius arisanus]